MSKLSFRARALDSTKPMPVFRAEEVPDLPDFAAINRAVPQMPTGMEKEEECEHHLQRAMSAQQAFGHTVEHVIPTPEVYSAPDKEYDELYPPNYKIPRQLIHMQLLAIEQDIPDYDMDSEDEQWLSLQTKQIKLTPIKFEEMMERLEKSSGQHVVTVKEAKLLLKEDDDLIIAVYDYWLNKRLKTQHPLIHLVKTEKRDGSTGNNPYVAFRRRTEKMQTRKNRKNDETSYEKMLKLRRDLSRAVNLLDLIKHREKLKREHLKCTVDIYEKRYQIGDFSGQIISEVSALRHIRPASTYLPLNNVQIVKMPERGVGRPRIRTDDQHSQPRRKREYKRRHRPETAVPPVRVEVHENNDYIFSSDEEVGSNSPVADQTSDQEEQEDPDGQYAFKRKRGCNYYAPLIDRLGGWPWDSPIDGGPGDRKYRFCLTSISKPKPRCIGFARRRYGRGGRLLIDRAYTPLNPFWSELSQNTIPNGFPSNELLSEIKNEWLHFRPRTPTQESSSLCYSSETVNNNEYDSDGNVIPVVAITSLKEFVDENNLNSNSLSAANGPQTQSEIDFESFHRHQEELFEMQRKQLERLKHNHQSGTDMTAVSNKTGYNLCNSDHSFDSPKAVANCQKSSSVSSTKWQSDSVPKLSSPQPSLQFSTLDSASIQFAVSVVRSASELTPNVVPNRTHNTNTSANSANDSSKDSPLNSYVINCETNQYLSDKCDKTIGATNGPTLQKDLLRKTFKNEICLPSTTSLTSLTSLSNTEHTSNATIDLHNTLPSPLTSSPTTCKLKFQNRSQKTNTNIPPTDVT